jgi:hypothetical protein
MRALLLSVTNDEPHRFPPSWSIAEAQHHEPELQDGEFRKLLDTLREPSPAIVSNAVHIPVMYDHNIASTLKSMANICNMFVPSKSLFSLFVSASGVPARARSFWLSCTNNSATRAEISCDDFISTVGSYSDILPVFSSSARA